MITVGQNRREVLRLESGDYQTQLTSKYQNHKAYAAPEPIVKAAIPGTYQYYYCAHEGGYPMPLETQHALADSAIALLSEKTIASDYELWVQGLIVRRDTLKMATI